MSQGENLAIETCEGLQLCNLEALASVERVEAHEIARRVVASENQPANTGSPDCASIPLRETDAPLGMTVCGDGTDAAV